VLPGYEILEQLGAGGFGEVRLARHRSLGRLVAVKRLRSFARADAGATERFRREARLLALIDCPQVVGVYDYRVSDGEALLVMEYVPGRPLDDLLRSEPPAAVAALRVLSDVAAALTAAAGRGIVHRDIKPANVFVLPAGGAKLGDFGLARITGDSAAFRTAAGLVTGTPAYLAPEVAAGGEPDLRSDAYSFAVLAYEVLAGRLPFDAGSIYALMAAHADAVPAAPSALVAGFPPEAEAALLAGLAKDPAARPLPADLVARLDAVPPQRWPGEVHPSPSRGAVRPAFRPPPLPLPQPRRRSQRRYLAGAGVAAVLAAGAVILVGRPFSADALTVRDVAVATTPANGATRCPLGSYVFTGQVATAGGGGTISTRWTQPDGRLAAVSQVRVARGQQVIHVVLRYDVRGDRSFDGVGRLTVLGPGPVRSATSVPIRYRCG
jgi:predicted Ser/Thr protein kinase